MPGKKIIIDCDPGHDDMMALMLACADPSLELLGVTTVAGNQTGVKTFANAQKILTLIGRTDLPLARGADKPLFRELTVAPMIHGKSGLDGAELPEAKMKPLSIGAVDLLSDLINGAGRDITLVPTGPLTNIALLLLKEPKIGKKIERIVLMGGGLNDSNITPAAEFNIYVDPEAADIVFSSGIPVTMVGLDVTNKSLMTFEQIKEMAKLKGRVTKIVAPLLDFFAKANKDVFGINGAPIHDALAVASLIDPSIIKTKDLHVAIETKGVLTRGRTVADVYGVTGQKPNASVALEVDAKKFTALLFNAIKTLDKV